LINCLGLKLSAALEAYQNSGLQPVVRYTCAPVKSGMADDKKRRTPRVIAVRGNLLIVSWFPDGPPDEKDPL